MRETYEVWADVTEDRDGLYSHEKYLASFDSFKEASTFCARRSGLIEPYECEAEHELLIIRQRVLK